MHPHIVENSYGWIGIPIFSAFQTKTLNLIILNKNFGFWSEFNTLFFDKGLSDWSEFNIGGVEMITLNFDEKRKFLSSDKDFEINNFQ